MPTFVPQVAHHPCPHRGHLDPPHMGQDTPSDPHRQVHPNHLLSSHLKHANSISNILCGAARGGQGARGEGRGGGEAVYPAQML